MSDLPVIQQRSSKLVLILSQRVEWEYSFTGYSVVLATIAAWRQIREKAIEMYMSGDGHRKNISKAMNIPLSSVKSIIKKWKECVNLTWLSKKETSERSHQLLPGFFSQMFIGQWDWKSHYWKKLIKNLPRFCQKACGRLYDQKKKVLCSDEAEIELFWPLDRFCGNQTLHITTNTTFPLWGTLKIEDWM